MGKAKFKMSVKEISFEFEGDVEMGRQIQTDITKTLATLGNAQARLLPPDPNVIEAEIVNPPENGNGKAKRNYRPRRPKAKSCRSLIVGLRQSGFFSEKRDANVIREELAKSGHNFKPNEISAALIPLCQNRILKRDQIEGGNYEYEQGDANVDTGNGEDAE
jgi:hypothetical protein